MESGVPVGIVIREAVSDDAAAMLDYLRAVGGETGNLSFGAEGLDLTVEQEAAILAEHSVPPACMLVATDGGAIVACGTVRAPSRHRIAHVAGMGLSVRRSHWGRGIGRAVFSELVRRSAEAGLERLRLSVREDNARARSLYEAAGFSYCGRETGAFAIGDERHDLLMMERPLP